MKLNLGSGSKRIEGYINVDKYDTFKPDIVHDLEKFPYPFENNSVTHVLLSHVLEHLGQNPDVFNSIIKELYRICVNKAFIDIRVPHPRHEDFISDPTHVRPITIMTLYLYDKEQNLKWKKAGTANTPLAIIHNVNFVIKKAEQVLDHKYKSLLEKGAIKKEELGDLANKYNNVVKEIKIIWEVVK